MNTYMKYFILMLITQFVAIMFFLTGCVDGRVPILDGNPIDECLMPHMVGTYESPTRFHEGCTRQFGHTSCAILVVYLGHQAYNVTCRKLPPMALEIEWPPVSPLWGQTEKSASSTGTPHQGDI